MSIRVKNLNIRGTDKFDGDTLINIVSVDLTINLITAIKMKNIEIRRIQMDHPYINAIVPKDGKANWDITKRTIAVAEKL
jgi:hypothetical protein